MKRAEAEIVAAAFLEANVFPDDLHDIAGLSNLVYGIVGNHAISSV